MKLRFASGGSCLVLEVSTNAIVLGGRRIKDNISLSCVHSGFLLSSVVLENTSFKCTLSLRSLPSMNAGLFCDRPVRLAIPSILQSNREYFYKVPITLTCAHTQRRKSRVRSSSDESGKGWEKGRHS